MTTGIAHEREVKGQIRLQFRDVSSQKCVVQRIMMATQKAKRIEMKTLDGVITRLDAAGEKKSISSKCAEIDREMITSLGVSKPVLENVIFCHQEDSNWPLSEGKNLKEKFDAIFASTRYVKALEAIRKLKQTQDQSLKLYKQDYHYLKQHKEKAAQLDADLNEYRAQLSASKDSVEKVTQQLQPIEDKLTKINEKANELFKIETEITKYTSEKNQMVKATRELQDSIENEFQGSTEELKRVLQEFQAKFEQRQSELTREMEKLGKERNSLLLEVGKLEQEAQTYDENVLTEVKLQMKSIKTFWKISKQNYRTWLRKMRDNKSKLEQSIHMKNNMMKENTDKIRNINKKLSEVEASAGKLDQLNRDLRKEEHELKTVEENVDVDKLKKEIADLANEKSKNDLKISDLKKSKQEDTITYLMGHMPTANIRDQLEDYIDKQSSLVKKVTQELQKTQTQLSSKEAEKKMTFESLKKQEDELKNLEEKIFTVCGSLMGAEYFFKKYVDDLEKEEPCCPLCHREFDTGQELRNKLRQVPAKLNKTETDLDEYKQKYDAMMQLKPLKENKEEDKQAKETDEEMAKEIHPDIVTMDRYQGEVTELDKKIATQSAALSGGGSGRSLQGVINEKEELQMQIAHEREVKGQIRLQFRDVSSQKCVVQRIMMATQKAKRIEMKTLDGVITRLDAAGEKKSISSKCAEIDREMITSLGVSKPVLENVIFCHQEDSNWPLSEGKNLKEKFDAIFASTRYVKALEAIRKLKQTQDQSLKLYKQDISYLKQHKEKAAQLDADLNEYRAQLSASKDSVEKVTHQLQSIEFEQRQSELTREMEKLGKERNSLLLEVGKLEQEAQTYDENVRKRDALIRQLADNYNFQGFNRGEITDEKYKNFLENIKRKLSDMVEEGKTLKKENTEKIRNINKKLSEVEASAGKLDQLNRDLRKEEHELKTVEEIVDVDKLKKEIADLANEKSRNDLKISDLNSEISRLHLQSSEQAKKSKQEDTITYLIGHMPTANIRDQLEDYIDKQSSLVKKVTQELQKTQTQLSSKEAEKKMTFESLKKQEDELKNLEEKIFTVCGSQDFDDGLSVLNEKIEKSQDQRGSLMGAEYFFKKYVDDLEKEEPCCPLCHREFDTRQELRNKLRQVPAKLSKTETDLDEYKQKYDAMMQLNPLKENIKTLEEKEIPDLKTKLKKINEEIEKFRNIIQEKEEDKQAKETDEEMAKEIHPDIVTMDRYQGEVTELDKKIATQSAALSGGGSGRSLQDVINEKEELQMQVDTVSRKLEHKKQKVSDHSEEVQHLKGNINTITSEKLRIESDLQQRIKLEEEKENLKSYNERTQKEVQFLKHYTKLTKLRSEKEEITQNKEAHVDGVKNNGIKVRNINQDIKVYVQAGKAETLIDKKKKHDLVHRKIEKLETESGEMTENIDKLRNDIATQRVRERELVDNLQLRKKQEEIQNVEVKIKELEDKLGGVEVINMERGRKRLLKQQEELIKEKHNLIGRQTGIEDMIRNARRELNSDMYKDASTKYRDQMIMLRTTEAIMSYHNQKMTEINKIIRDLWRNTYRGNDIETIEIRSDEEDGSVMKARRNYNYRVVMIRGDTALDMRGRCRAGQKVLASLIIRLALAETFCLNCGILALDEPTTNLDRENIESLAYALVEIIKSRAQQRNFQLVVITHDEDFVDLLGRSDYVDAFFKVSKDQNGFSVLKRARIQDLGTR
ncbi:hypothetical protein KUTeg_024572 [Tegillarca granosa]|uniref:Zinc-hook domain-containing protein n=1 Tax=Tegillarca granosa TaxID=220873 RepID=A0ABQ9DXQ6_TEGGR|nr:hypothetical protein KUTeg_024572 [Tegillarca granosa]